MIYWIPPAPATITRTDTSLQIDTELDGLIRRLHALAIGGASSLKAAGAMRVQGYDQVAWAEGQCLLAELVANGPPAPSTVAAATKWYDRAASTARVALADQPHLLDSLGLRAT
jgi:hypothetical protein